MDSTSKTEKVVIVCPALQEENNGNWRTARRWAQFLSGHCASILLPQWPSPANSLPVAAMIALHARRSAPSIHAWAQQYPGKALIVVLTGTDLYRDIRSDADAQASLKLATHLVVLQEAGLHELPPALRQKTSVIYQSARPLQPAAKSGRRFRALMVGHLRDEKDPLTYLRAAARCDPSQMFFESVGEALQPDLALAASKAQAGMPHYRWLGGLPLAQTRQRIKRAHVLVNSSLMEGGAHVILEAVQSGTAVLASRISGNIGMLGDNYAGYFPAGDDAGLAALMQRCASQPAFLALLENQCRDRALLFSPAREKRLVINLVNSALKASS